MNRKAVGHIEMILAFILFAGALFGGLYFFSPQNSSRLIDSTLDYAMREIQEFGMEKIEYYAVKIKPMSSNKNYIEINLDNYNDLRNKVIVKDKEGNTLDSTSTNNNKIKVGTNDITKPRSNSVFIKYKNYYGGNKDLDFVYIYICSSDTCTTSLISGENYIENDTNNYNFSSHVKKTTILEQNITKLREWYLGNLPNKDYASLKKEFNLPDRVDFGFELDFGDGAVPPQKITAIKEIPKGLEVFADSERVEVLRTDGTIKYADLIVKVW